MLYLPGQHLGIEPNISITPDSCQQLNDMRTDTATMLECWNETFSIHRLLTSYDAVGMATETWSLISTFEGDWQAMTGVQIREEVGRSQKSDAVIYTEVQQGVLDNDKIYRSDGSFEYVNYVRNQEDHVEIRLKSVSGQK